MYSQFLYYGQQTFFPSSRERRLLCIYKKPSFEARNSSDELKDLYTEESTRGLTENTENTENRKDDLLFKSFQNLDDEEKTYAIFKKLQQSDRLKAVTDPNISPDQIRRGQNIVFTFPNTELEQSVRLGDVLPSSVTRITVFQRATQRRRIAQRQENGDYIFEGNEGRAKIFTGTKITLLSGEEGKEVSVKTPGERLRALKEEVQQDQELKNPPADPQGQQETGKDSTPNAYPVFGEYDFEQKEPLYTTEVLSSGIRIRKGKSEGVSVKMKRRIPNPVTPPHALEDMKDATEVDPYTFFSDSDSLQTGGQKQAPSSELKEDFTEDEPPSQKRQDRGLDKIFSSSVPAPVPPLSPNTKESKISPEEAQKNFERYKRIFQKYKNQTKGEKNAYLETLMNAETFAEAQQSFGDMPEPFSDAPQKMPPSTEEEVEEFFRLRSGNTGTPYYDLSTEMAIRFKDIQERGITDQVYQKFREGGSKYDAIPQEFMTMVLMKQIQKSSQQSLQDPPDLSATLYIDGMWREFVRTKADYFLAETILNASESPDRERKIIPLNAPGIKQQIGEYLEKNIPTHQHVEANKAIKKALDSLFSSSFFVKKIQTTNKRGEDVSTKTYLLSDFLPELDINHQGIVHRMSTNLFKNGNLWFSPIGGVTLQLDPISILQQGIEDVIVGDKSEGDQKVQLPHPEGDSDETPMLELHFTFESLLGVK